MRDYIRFVVRRQVFLTDLGYVLFKFQVLFSLALEFNHWFQSLPGGRLFILIVNVHLDFFCHIGVSALIF